MKGSKKVLIAIASVLIVVVVGVLVAVFLGVFNRKVEPKILFSEEFKLSYYEGETLDVSGGKLLFTQENGEIVEVVITEDMITGFDTTTPGEKQLTITFNDATMVVTYTVLASLEDLTLVSFPKTTYYDRQQLDLAGATLMYTANNGDILYVPLTEDMVTGFDTSRIRYDTHDGVEVNRVATIEYNGCQTTFNYTVVHTNAIRQELTPEEDAQYPGGWYIYSWASGSESINADYIIENDTFKLRPNANGFSGAEYVATRTDEIRNGSYIYRADLGFVTEFDYLQLEITVNSNGSFMTVDFVCSDPLYEASYDLMAYIA